MDDIAAVAGNAELFDRNEAALESLNQIPSEHRSGLQLTKRAEEAIQRFNAPSFCDQAGVGKAYLRTQASEQASQAASSHSIAATPADAIRAAAAMLRWSEFIACSSDAVKLTSLATSLAHGVACDYTVRATDFNQSRSVGAVWECLVRSGCPQESVCSDAYGGGTLSLTVAADAADQLFLLHERAEDRISLNAALRASQWLLLHQRADGTYPGDRVQAESGVILPDERAGRQAAIHAAVAFIRAFRAGGAEVYIRAAARALHSALAQIAPQSAAAEPISRLAQAATMMYAESASTRNRNELEQAAYLLSQFNCGSSSYGADASATEPNATTALAALDMFVAIGETSWLDMALQNLSAAAADCCVPDAHSVEAYFATLLALPALIVGCQPDLRDGHVRVGWTSYTADPAASEAVSICANDAEFAAIDALPLVSKIGRSVLVPVLAKKSVASVLINSGQRRPNLTDLVTGETVCQPAPLHELPFRSDYRWGCYLIEH